jgi:hypothetical protein
VTNVDTYSSGALKLYHPLVHNLELYKCRTTIAGDKFYMLHACTKLNKENLLFRRTLKQLLIKACSYSVEEYMCDILPEILTTSVVILSVVYIYIYLY